MASAPLGVPPRDSVSLSGLGAAGRVSCTCGCTPPDVLRVADLELDLARHKAWRAGVRIALTAKEMALLALFMRRSGEVLSRTLIAEQVWDMHFDSDTNVVDVAVRRLRAKIDEPFATKLIHTLRGVGYVLETSHAD